MLKYLPIIDELFHKEPITINQRKFTLRFYSFMRSFVTLAVMKRGCILTDDMHIAVKMHLNCYHNINSTPTQHRMQKFTGFSFCVLLLFFPRIQFTNTILLTVCGEAFSIFFEFVGKLFDLRFAFTSNADIYYLFTCIYRDL